jgi:hypothetical protein
MPTSSAPYPKTYAIITRRHPDDSLTMITTAGAEVTSHVRARNGGRTPSAMIRPGLTVKLYMRGPWLNWRRVGR